MCCSKSLQLCLTLCNTMDYSLPGSSVHGIFQARVLKGLPCPLPENLPNLGTETVSVTSNLRWQVSSTIFINA